MKYSTQKYPIVTIIPPITPADITDKILLLNRLYIIEHTEVVNAFIIKSGCSIFGYPASKSASMEPIIADNAPFKFQHDNESITKESLDGYPVGDGTLII